MDVKIKQLSQMTHFGLTELEQRVVLLAQNNPVGISQRDIDKELPNLRPNDKAQLINKLLNKSFLGLSETKDGTLLYTSKDPAKAIAIKGADNEEKIVYSLIEAAGNKGIWIREIRYKANLKQTQLTKVLKNLETKKLIKHVQSVADGKKKVYMLYNLEPDESVSGGAWYQDQDFDAEFANVLNQECYRFLEHRRYECSRGNSAGPMVFKNETYCFAEDVFKFIVNLGISKVELEKKDIEQILNTLIYDGKVEKCTTASGKNLYRATNPLLKPSGLIATPCGVCPVRHNCDDLGDVTPNKCQYITEWLE